MTSLYHTINKSGGGDKKNCEKINYKNTQIINYKNVKNLQNIKIQYILTFIVVLKIHLKLKIIHIL